MTIGPYELFKKHNIMNRDFTKKRFWQPKLTPLWLILLGLLWSPTQVMSNNEACDDYTMDANESAEAFDVCCFLPHDATIYCDQLPYGFDPYDIYDLQGQFGVPGYHFGCNYYAWYELPPQVYLNNCDVGHITRRFEVYNPSGGYGETNTVICTQTIWIVASHHYQIKFPEDEIAYCEEPNPQGIQYDEFGCDLLAVSTTDLQFNISGDACYKILRTYRVINWCEYDGISPAIVIGRDEDCDGDPGDECVWIVRRPDGNVFVDRNNDPFDYNPGVPEINQSCGHTGLPGYWRVFNIAQYDSYYGHPGFFQYTQHIKVTDEDDPIINFDEPDPFCSFSSNFGEGCPGQVGIPFSVVEECSEQTTIKIFLFAFNEPVPLTAENNIADEVLSGTFPNYNLSGYFPIGSHTFEVHVKDGCGNSTAVAIPFEVVDCKAPAPICISGLSSGYMPTEANTDADGDGDIDQAAMAVWAVDFIGSPNSDCTPPIKYSINRQGETPDINSDGIVLTCDDGNTVVLEIYAWDSAFNPYAVQPDGSVGGPNYDHCTTYITMQMSNCDPPAPLIANVAGLIRTSVDEDSTVSGVEVFITGGVEEDMMTESDGEYYFSDLDGGLDYTIHPEKNDDPLNGLSTADLIILRKHILGLDTIESPYTLIAADLNNSGDIDSEDGEILRRLVLHIDTVMTHTDSWRFVDAAYVFPDTMNPWQETFPEEMFMEAIEGDYDSLDFIAIKMGDMNRSAELYDRNLESRSQGEVYGLAVKDVILEVGAFHTFTISSEAVRELDGYQFGLAFDQEALELVEIQHGQTTDANFGKNYLEKGVLTTNWFEQNELGQMVDGDIFSLVFQAKKGGRLSDYLNINAAYTKAEAYRQNGEVTDLELQFSKLTLENEVFQLFANQPNPFKAATQIRFYMPDAGGLTLHIRDLTGRLLQHQRFQFEKGHQQIEVKGSDLQSAGVLFYTLEYEGQALTGRMVLVR